MARILNSRAQRGKARAKLMPRLVLLGEDGSCTFAKVKIKAF
jgi:hypothetical protein